MPTDILYQTFAAMWPLLLAIVVWVLANQTSDENDAYKQSIGLTMRRARRPDDTDDRRARSGRPHYRRELRIEGRPASSERLRPHLRLRRALHYRSASAGNARSSKRLPSVRY